MSLDQFAKWWSIGANSPPKEASLICLVSFGTTRTDYTNGLKNVVRLGLQQQKRYPHAKIVFGEFTKNPVPRLEMNLKMELFPDAIYAGQVLNTIGEAEKWKSAFPTDFIPKDGVVIVTDEVHSRSAKRISNRVWNGWWLVRLWKWISGKPMVQIFVVTFPTKNGIDPESPMTSLRDKKLWVRNNVLRELFLMFVPFGYSIMKKLNIHQPIAK